MIAFTSDSFKINWGEVIVGAAPWGPWWGILMRMIELNDFTWDEGTSSSTVSRTSSPAGMKPSSRIFSNIRYCACRYQQINGLTQPLSNNRPQSKLQLQKTWTVLIKLIQLRTVWIDLKDWTWLEGLLDRMTWDRLMAGRELTFHCASGVPRMVTLRSACGSADVPSGSEVILTEEPEKRMMLRMCDPRVPMMAPTALFGMYK